MTKQIKIRIPYNYNPYKWQVPILANFEQGKDLYLNIHRRGGKDLISFCGILLPEAIEKPGTYYYIWPLLKQGRDAIWKGKDHQGNDILDYYIPKELLVHKDNSDMRLTLRTPNGGTSIIQLFGVNKGQYENIRGKPANGIVLSEASRMLPQIMDVINPMLIATKGWKVIQSTPNGQNWFYNTFKMASLNPQRNFCFTATIDDTFDHNNIPIITKEQVQQQIDDGTMTEEVSQQEYWCSFLQGIEGTYIGKQLQELEENERIEYLPYDPNFLVDTYWDLGISEDSMSVWFLQQVGQEIRFIDFEEATGQTFVYWKRLLDEKGYLYGQHWAPHDIQVKEMVGKTEVAQSRLTHAKDIGILFNMVPRASFENRVMTLRGILGMCRFDMDRCAKGLNHLRLWGKRWNNIEMRYMDEEKNDQHTHAAAAIGYAAINIRHRQGYDVTRGREEYQFKRAFRRSAGGSAMAL